MAAGIPRDLQFVSEDGCAAYLASVLRDNLPGGIYIEQGDEPNEVFLISRGEESAGIFRLLVQQAEFRVNDGS